MSLLQDAAKPKEDDEGFLYLVPNYSVEKKVYKFGSFKVTSVVHIETSEHYKKYMLSIEKIDEKGVTPPLKVLAPLAPLAPAKRLTRPKLKMPKRKRLF